MSERIHKVRDSAVRSRKSRSQKGLADAFYTAGQRAEALQRAQRTPERLTSDDILHLQQTFGNQVTRRLLGHGSQPQVAGPSVQRAIENETYGASVSESDKEKAKAFFSAFNAAVQRAYQYVIMVPSLGAYGELNGYTKLWGEKWAEFTGGGRPKLMAASFGYVIESLVSEGSSSYRPAPPSECSIYTQVTSGGTRPDLVLRLKKGGTDIAWLDLTASESADHIFSKEGWNTKIGIFAEVTYPSLDPGTLALMVQNKDNTGELSAEEFKKRQELAKALYEKRKAYWAKLGKEKYSVSALRTKLSAYWRPRGVKNLRMALETKPELKRTFIHKELEAGFGAKIDDEKIIPSILAALAINPSSWEFTTGFNMSERAGEAWLVDNDPSLETADTDMGTTAESEELGEADTNELGEDDLTKAKSGTHGKAISSYKSHTKKKSGYPY